MLSLLAIRTLLEQPLSDSNDRFVLDTTKAIRTSYLNGSNLVQLAQPQ